MHNFSTTTSGSLSLAFVKVDPTLISKQQLFARIVGGFGGRAAEEVIFGEPEVTTGAAGDLQRSLVWQNNGYGCLVQECKGINSGVTTATAAPENAFNDEESTKLFRNNTFYFTSSINL
nr:FtsH-like protein [Ipomoea batatas]